MLDPELGLEQAGSPSRWPVTVEVASLQGQAPVCLLGSTQEGRAMQAGLPDGWPDLPFLHCLGSDSLLLAREVTLAQIFRTDALMSLPKVLQKLPLPSGAGAHAPILGQLGKESPFQPWQALPISQLSTFAPEPGTPLTRPGSQPRLQI